VTELLLHPFLGHPPWLWLLFIAIVAALLAFASAARSSS
jgi:hypothetical protein